MTRFQVTLGIILIAGSLLASTAEIPKPGYTRTMLKVARSLPGETEELKVRTSEGNVATLIVKRREKSGNNEEQRITPQESNIESVLEEKNKNLSSPSSGSAEPIARDRKDEVRKSENQQIEEIRERTSSGNFSLRPEEPEVRRVSNDSERGVSPSTAVNRSALVNEDMIDYSNWTPLSVDGRALETNNGKIDDDSSWKPLKKSADIIPNDRTNFARFQIASNRRDGSIFGRNLQNRETKSYDLEGIARAQIVGNQPIQYAFLPHQPRPLTRTNIGANLSKNRGGKNVPPEVTVRSEINVKSLAKRTPMSIDANGIPVIHGTRVPDEPIDKIQTWRNSRVINNKLVTESADSPTIESSTGFYASENVAERQRFERFFKDVNRRYGRNFGDEKNVYFEWDPKKNQNSELNAEVYEARNDNYRSNIQKRMLHPDNYQIYPISQMYTPESQKISPLALKPGARAPVLQYAHPELGVQPAKILKNTEKRRPENFPENQNSFTEQRHKKKYVLNDKNVVDSYNLKNYYPNQHFYGLKQPSEQPFWVKISENLRNQFSTGVERVSQLTKPVFDPLVEATQKISENLGLSRGKEAQDKIGTVATGGSILIPALGLVASGAALGIGAVAVGRYLDVDVLKRAKKNMADDAELENSRALGAMENPSGRADETIDWKSSEESNGASRQSESTEFHPSESYVVPTSPTDSSDSAKGLAASASSRDEQDGVFLILEEVDGKQRIEHRQTQPMVDESSYVEATKRRRRNVGQPDLPSVEEIEQLSEKEHLRRTGSDSLMEIIEIDAPTIGNTDIADTLRDLGNKDPERLLTIHGEPELYSLAKNSVDPEKMRSRKPHRVQPLVDQSRPGNRDEIQSRRRYRRSVHSDRGFYDALQNIENAEISEAAHVGGDWTNTPCAKRIFCDAMMKRGQDATMFMEKKMDSLLGLIQPEAALQVSRHFQDVMEAVKRHDCSSFLCPQARPGNASF